MIRYIAVNATDTDDEVFHIPETAVELISRLKDGRAEISFREVREDDTAKSFSTATDWRVTGYAVEKAYSVMPHDDLIAWLNGVPAPVEKFPNSPLWTDVQTVIALLAGGEWAEHCTSTDVGGRLEAEITRLVGNDNAATNKLQRAEQLLAEIHHAVNNDGGLYPIGPDSDLVARLSEYLYPDPVAALDRIGSQTTRDILDE